MLQLPARRRQSGVSYTFPLIGAYPAVVKDALRVGWMAPPYRALTGGWCAIHAFMRLW
jgi:hypothetical protein